MSIADLKRPVVSGHESRKNPVFDLRRRANHLLGWLITRLGPNELRRRIWHMSPGLLPLILWGIPHADPMSPTLRSIVILASIGLGGAIFVRYRHIQRQEDCGRLMSVLGYAGSVLAMLLLFPADVELGLTVLAILAFGDGAATFFGRLFRGPRLPWNPNKSWSGLMGFLVVGTIAASVIYWGETHNLEATTPGVSFFTAFLYAAITVTVAALAESMPSRMNDNIRVGVAASVAIILLHFGVIDWISMSP
ncbi:MAG: hypothetical protein Tsb009_10370 [Planctomycetaceae bacterium]